MNNDCTLTKRSNEDEESTRLLCPKSESLTPSAVIPECQASRPASKVHLDISQTSESHPTTSQTSSVVDAAFLARLQEMTLDLIIADQFTEEERANPILALSRLLCTRSTISTSLCLITRMQIAISLRADTKFREIGRGSAGQVYEHPGEICLYKYALIDVARTKKLWNNYRMHHHIQEAFNRPRTINIWDVEIPRCFWYANESSGGFWDHNQRKYPIKGRKR